MWTSMWFTSVLATLVVDIRTGALQNKELEPRRCYQCLDANSTVTCSQEKVALSCSAEQPYCGTVAVGPRFASLLKCLPEFKSTCSMKLISNSSFELSCVCSGILCNALFTKTTQNRLQQFAKSNTVNSTDVTKAFYKFFNLENATDVYRMITTDEETTSTTATLTALTKLTELMIGSNNSSELDIPHAEPLKHEATVPPDDDEDETEGSGSYDDAKTPKNTASAPAAPSSYLPAEENNASQLAKNTLIIISLLIII